MKTVIGILIVSVLLATNAMANPENIASEQKKEAQQSREALEKSGIFEDVIVTSILPARSFYSAEQYHQDYHKKHPLRYQQYRQGSGRALFLQPPRAPP